MVNKSKFLSKIARFPYIYIYRVLAVVLLLTGLFINNQIAIASENIFNTPSASPSVGSGVSSTDEEKLGGLEVGSIIAWYKEEIPDKWLECNGQSVPSTYSKLQIIMSKVPDLRGRFLEGSNTPGQIKNAGLPEIEGSLPPIWGANDWFVGIQKNKAFTANSYRGNRYGGVPSGLETISISFKASDSNPIYGNSTTVQPPSVTVKYIIKAE